MICQTDAAAFLDFCAQYAKRTKVLDREAILANKHPRHAIPEEYEALVLFDEPEGHETDLIRWMNLLSNIKYQSSDFPHTNIHEPDWVLGLFRGGGKSSLIDTYWGDSILMYQIWNRKLMPPALGGNVSGVCLCIRLKDANERLIEIFHDVLQANYPESMQHIDEVVSTFDRSYTSGASVSIMNAVIAHVVAYRKTHNLGV